MEVQLRNYGNNKPSTKDACLHGPFFFRKFVSEIANNSAEHLNERRFSLKAHIYTDGGTFGLIYDTRLVSQ